MRNLLNKLIRKLGKKDYSLDENLETGALLAIVIRKSMDLLRGIFCYKLFLKSSKGLLFVGSGCRLSHKRKMSFGKTLTLGHHVEINALSKQGVVIGDNVTIKSDTVIECTGVFNDLGEGLKIGNHVGISQGCFIQVRGFVEIGSHVIFGPHVSIFSENHIFEDPNEFIMKQGVSKQGVVIEDDVWLGAGCTILAGVRVGKGSVVAAGSVVNRNVEPYSVVGGIPARLIKHRK